MTRSRNQHHQRTQPPYPAEGSHNTHHCSSSPTILYGSTTTPTLLYSGPCLNSTSLPAESGDLRSAGRSRGLRVWGRGFGASAEAEYPR